MSACCIWWQAALGDAPGTESSEDQEKTEGYAAEERYEPEEPNSAALELAEKEVEHATAILRYPAEDNAK